MTAATTASLVVVGAGQRGLRYAHLAMAQGARIVAVADPVAERRHRLGQAAGVPERQCVADWSDIVALDRIADAAVVATPDHLHVGPAVALLELGYDVLLEKPMAQHEEDARRIVAAADASGSHLVVAHVLRYAPVTRAVEALLGDDGIGDIVSLQHLEPVGDWHFTHSYVRGNWRSEAASGPVLLTKSCHDIDWLSHIVGSPAVRISSFGGRYEFRPERAPAGAGARCPDCAIEPDCAFSARRLYLSALDQPEPWTWPLTVVTDVHTREALEAALRDGPYGRCVYAGENDVLDHQAVTIEYESGAVASFLLSAFTPRAGRKTRIGGTRGHLDIVGNAVELYRFIDGSTTFVEMPGLARPGAEPAHDHDSADEALLQAFVAALRSGQWSALRTDAHESLRTHRLVWAAEAARHSGQVVRVDR
jgi:predicted dehydrogenase